jgi:hypothetical protein
MRESEIKNNPRYKSSSEYALENVRCENRPTSIPRTNRGKNKREEER